MLNSVLFGTYCVTVGIIGANTIRAKLMDDMDRELKAYREYDFNYEKMKPEQFQKAKEENCIILAKYTAPEGTEDKVYFKRKLPFFHQDSAGRFFQTRLGRSEAFSFEFNQSEKNAETPLKVTFPKGLKLQCFDIDTIELTKNPPGPANFKDRIVAWYEQRLGGG
jgi:hypothetical protein